MLLETLDPWHLHRSSTTPPFPATVSVILDNRKRLRDYCPRPLTKTLLLQPFIVSMLLYLVVEKLLCEARVNTSSTNLIGASPPFLTLVILIGYATLSLRLSRLFSSRRSID